MEVPDRVLVVGGVAAGMSAASQIRRRSPKTRVTVYERGDFISYGACGMPYNIEDPERDIEDLVVLTAEDARKKRGIDLKLRHEATALDLENRSVTIVDRDTGKESNETFEALVIATGARALRLPLDGFDLPGVHVLRDLGDGRGIKDALKEEPKRAVIVGAGYIGMEMAQALIEYGVDVTVVEMMDQIMPGVLDPDIALLGANHLKENGVNLVLGERVVSLEGEENVSGVRTDKQLIGAVQFSVKTYGSVKELYLFGNVLFLSAAGAGSID